MGTLSSLFDLSRSSLEANQAALSVTSNNVANQNTPGYTREVASFATGDTVTLSNGSVASEAPTVTVSSQRNRVLEHRVQQATQAQSGTAAEAAVLADVENVFSLSGSAASTGSTAIGSSLNGFYSALTSLTAAPADTATQQAVLTAAQTLAGALNTAAQQLSQISAGINSDLASSVSAVDGLTSTIASLNAKIAAASPSEDAGGLEDQRQQAIAQLSQYIGLDQITTEGNGITLTTTSGAPLVAGQQAYTLIAANVGGAIEIRDSLGNDISASVQGGSIGGQLQAQNTELPKVSSALDAVAYRLATAVNQQNAAGVTASGAAGGAIFAIPASAQGAATAISVIATSPGAIATAAAGEGSAGNSNALALAAIATGTDANGTTITGQFAGLLSDVGSTSAGLQEQNATQQATLTALTTQRDSFSAVSLDTEAANLSLYQQSYNASAKLFSIVDTLLAAAINLGTETTVS